MACWRIDIRSAYISFTSLSILCLVIQLLKLMVAIASRMPMIAITTINSIRENPRRFILSLLDMKHLLDRLLQRIRRRRRRRRLSCTNIDLSASPGKELDVSLRKINYNDGAGGELNRDFPLQGPGGGAAPVA